MQSLLQNVSHWIFVMSTDNKEFRKRIACGEWPIFQHTPNRKKLKAGDRVIFYLAGEHGRKFVGNCTLNSALKEKENGLDSSVCLSDIMVWKMHVDVHDVLEDLDFIYKKNIWGCYFQGGVLTISEKDHRLILSNVK